MSAKLTILRGIGFARYGPQCPNPELRAKYMIVAERLQIRMRQMGLK